MRHGIPLRHSLTVNAYLGIYRPTYKNFFSFGKRGKKSHGMGLELESTMDVTRRLPSPTSEISLQFQMYMAVHYHAVDKHADILSLDDFSNNII